MPVEIINVGECIW